MMECLRKNDVSTTDHKDMIKCTKTSDRFFSGPGLHPKQRDHNKVDY